MDFRIVDKETGKALSRRYTALSKNVSIEGLCFCCGQRLAIGDTLLMDVEIPGERGFVKMEGEVRWSNPSVEEDTKFNTGVHLTLVNNNSVLKTFMYNEKNQVVWSGVLEAIIGSFR